MKKALLLIVALFFSTVSFSQGVFGLFNKSQDLFELFAQGKFQEAHEFFDPTAKEKISVETLQKLWSQLRNNLDTLESVDVIKSSTEGAFYVILVEAKFNKGIQNFRLVYNKQEKIVGLFIAPATNQPVYRNPIYADTTKYIEKEIYIESPGHKLVGKLTLPRGVNNFPIVVLVHGSGPGDMDQTIGPNKPFKDIAAGFAAQGIATIRYVKRTLVYAGEFNKAFTVKEEVLDDALAAIALARTIPGASKGKIFLLGHSLGGMLAPRIATAAPDLAGIILAAAPARKLTDILIEQNKYFYELSKDTTAAVLKKYNNAIANIEKGRITKTSTIKPDSILNGLPVSYWKDLNSYDQVSTAKALVKPRIMVIQGGMDFQVSQTDYDLWKTALSTKKNSAFKFYPDLNHLLTPQMEKGNPKQYQTPANVSVTLINDMVNWIEAP